jgi:hypothetical protein
MSAGQSTTIFESVSIPGAWGNDEMDQLRNNLHVNVYAYAVQYVGLENSGALAALQEGFNVFDNVTLPNN